MTETKPISHDLAVAQAIDRYLDRVEQLPPAPLVATQLLGLFNDPDRDIDRIVELVSTDPALTAETLKRCNGTCFVGAEPASDMFEAVTRLGFYEIYCIVVGLIASRTMTQVRSKYSSDATQLWRHTVTTAVIASILAKRVQEAEATAFTAGLLHDIGKLIFISVEMDWRSFASVRLFRAITRCGRSISKMARSRSV
jgi:HD-like signal output (HDOD) protein